MVNSLILGSASQAMTGFTLSGNHGTVFGAEVICSGLHSLWHRQELNQSSRIHPAFPTQHLEWEKFSWAELLSSYSDIDQRNDRDDMEPVRALCGAKHRAISNWDNGTKCRQICEWVSRRQRGWGTGCFNESTLLQNLNHLHLIVTSYAIWSKDCAQWMVWWWCD